MLESIAFFIFGLVVGMASGLVPGLHPNLISSVLLLQNIDYGNKAVLIISVYAGNLVFSCVPAIFFGVPDGRSMLSVLPGQRMAKEGRGIEAIKIYTVAILGAAAISTLLAPLAITAYPIAYSALRPYIFQILLLASLAMLIKAKTPVKSSLVFIASGALGIYALGEGRMSEPFLPLFSGFFAMGALLNYKKTRMIGQKDHEIGLGVLKFAALGAGLGWVANVFPAIGSPGQVAALASIFIALESRNYLATVAAVNAGQFVFSLAASAGMDKARNGVALALSQVLDVGGNMQMLLLVFLCGSAISALALFILRKKIAVLASFDFSEFNKLLVVYLAALVFALNGVPGLAVFAVSSVIGWITVREGIERTSMMGALIIPTAMLLA